MNEFNLPFDAAIDTSCLRCMPMPLQDLDRMQIGRDFFIVYDGRFDAVRYGAKGVLRGWGWSPQRV